MSDDDDESTLENINTVAQCIAALAIFTSAVYTCYKIHMSSKSSFVYTLMIFAILDAFQWLFRFILSVADCYSFFWITFCYYLLWILFLQVWIFGL